MSQVKFDPKEHRYFDLADREYPAVSRILEYFGISQIEKFKAIHGEEHLAKLAAFGKEIHHLTAAEDRHELNKWKYDKKLDPYIEAWCSFRFENKMKFLAIEEPLISRIWGFAGTPDRVVDRGRFLEICDLKTGITAPTADLQTAFYQILVEENYKKPVQVRYSVHLDPKMPLGYKIIHHKNKGDVNVAKAMMTIYNTKRERNLL